MVAMSSTCFITDCDMGSEVNFFLVIIRPIVGKLADSLEVCSGT